MARVNKRRGREAKKERLKVRPIAKRDRSVVTQLWREVDDLHAQLWPRFFRAGSREDPEKLLAGRRSDTETVLVADLSGVTVGVVHAQLFDTPDLPTLVSRRRVHIEDLVVTASARRKGVARCLVDAVTKWGKGRGASEVVLVVWEGNRAASRFYRSLGFAPVHRVLGLEI